MCVNKRTGSSSESCANCWRHNQVEVLKIRRPLLVTPRNIHKVSDDGLTWDHHSVKHLLLYAVMARKLNHFFGLAPFLNSSARFS